MNYLHGLVKEIIQTIIPEQNISKYITTPPSIDLGDVAFGCFALAKVYKKSPNEIAKDIASKVSHKLVKNVNAVGPYVNFYFNSKLLLIELFEQLESGKLFEDMKVSNPQKIMIEFSQPNTHKNFHVGHLRNVAIGDSLVQIHRALGHEVIAANYYGDFGIDIAKCLWYRNKISDTEQTTAALGAAYTAANSELEKNPEDLDEVRGFLKELNCENSSVYFSYLETRQWCLDEFQDIYQWLNVSFDVDFFESVVEKSASKIVDYYLSNGIFTTSNNAIVCDLNPELDTPALVRKSDGSSLYLTWDLALAKEKFDNYKIDRSYYVVGSEQRFHFQQLFLTLQKMGYDRAKDCEHISYELVMLPEGKMSSRNGTAIPFRQLQSNICNIIAQKMEGRLGCSQGIIHRLAVACLKYGMLQVGKNKPVIFEMNQWTNLKGDTGIYLLYTIARLRSILSKVTLNSDTINNISELNSNEERALLNHLFGITETLQHSADLLDSSILANWVFSGSQLFNKFYDTCHIVDSEESVKQARIVLIKTANVILTYALSLLGIATVDIM